MTNPAGDRTRTVVHLLRHGEVLNPTGVLYGRMDGFHLSALGFEMAEAVEAHLADHDLAVVVASSLRAGSNRYVPVSRFVSWRRLSARDQALRQSYWMPVTLRFRVFTTA